MSNNKSQYIVRSPLLNVIDEHGKRIFSRKLARMSRLVFWIVIPVFLAGFIIGDVHGIRSARVEMFNAGYDAAMNHVRTTIEAKMPELQSFYMADLGIKFIPRGINIAGIKYVSRIDDPKTQRPDASTPGLAGDEFRTRTGNLSERFACK